MKKIISLCAGLLFSASISASAAPDITNILGKVVSGAKSTTTTSSSTSSGLSTLGNIVSGLIASSDVELSSMVGTWKYSSPAVCFKSDDLLKKAGGSAIATTIENKIAPYYKTAGINNLTLTITSDNAFTMKFSKGSLSGTISKKDNGDIIFNFNALGKIKIGSMTSYVTLSGSTMSITFDVSKLVSIIKAAGSISGNSTVKSISSILESYDGICAGFKMTKQ